MLWTWWIVGLVLSFTDVAWPFLASLVVGVAAGIIWYAIEIAGGIGKAVGRFARAAAVDAKVIAPSEARPAPAVEPQPRQQPDSKPARVPD